MEAYPSSLSELEAWRKANQTTLQEARKRFAQFVILRCIASTSKTRDSLAFKGGNALRLLHQSRRTTVDLDFSFLGGVPTEASIRKTFDAVWKQYASRYGMKAKCQRVRQNPKGDGRTQPTFEVHVGYQLQGDRHFPDFETWKQDFSSSIDLEISINEVVCETHPMPLRPGSDVQIKVCTLEDIIAEKLRALLQQRIRHRHRKQDVYDIALLLRRHGKELNKLKIADYFLRKSLARGIEPTRQAFNEDIQKRAAYEYETLFSNFDPDFIPFNEAWQEIIQLVNELDIPQI